jgi:prepilin-type N-terminal cleavage/methylation domain-containing protein
MDKTILNNDGYSILEVLISIAIFSIMFAAMSAGVFSAHNNYRTTVFADQAVMAGQESIEMLAVMNMSPDNVYNQDLGAIKVRYQVLNSVDTDADGLTDFQTIAMSIFHSDDNILDPDELRMKSYFRRSLNK